MNDKTSSFLRAARVEEFIVSKLLQLMDESGYNPASNTGKLVMDLLTDHLQGYGSAMVDYKDALGGQR